MTAPSIRISASMVRDHLSIVTVGWFDDRNLPPPAVENYAPLVAELHEIVTESGDLPWFVLGLQHVLLTPSVSARGLANTRFAYSERESRELMAYVLKELAPGQVPDPKGPAARVDLQEMPRREWRALREGQQVPS
jgi:hypothetical protein